MRVFFLVEEKEENRVNEAITKSEEEQSDPPEFPLPVFICGAFRFSVRRILFARSHNDKHAGVKAGSFYVFESF